ncbi:MAG: nucleotidyltransferase family protein [Bacteroidales bacterium]|jgi:D-glycero-alpha-D-manno-heptose 1-phosphate guanylyltransferase|nr:nucleotidyltransferase family protein [Bacteroidales bacterium]
MDDQIEIHESLILAGGFGTRLQSVVSDIPKPMAIIDDKPFLEYLLLYLYRQGCRHCVLSVGYKHEQIIDYFGDRFLTIKLDYAIEDNPLGTGGGIKNGLHFLERENFFLLNGDSLFNVDLKELAQYHFQNNADVTLSLKRMIQAERYGTVEIENGRVLRFNEKKFVDNGLINGGVYVASKKIFNNPALGKKFSFEKNVLEENIKECPIFALIFDNYFIDIGVPEDYNKAKKELIILFNKDNIQNVEE